MATAVSIHLFEVFSETQRDLDNLIARISTTAKPHRLSLIHI